MQNSTGSWLYCEETIYVEPNKPKKDPSKCKCKPRCSSEPASQAGAGACPTRAQGGSAPSLLSIGRRVCVCVCVKMGFPKVVAFLPVAHSRGATREQNRRLRFRKKCETQFGGFQLAVRVGRKSTGFRVRFRVVLFLPKGTVAPAAFEGSCGSIPGCLYSNSTPGKYVPNTFPSELPPMVLPPLLAFCQ